jgi:glycosyltransferase involved in cell wall biosynthesis
MNVDAEKDKRVLYVQYTNPAAYPPLQHSSRILAEAGWDVLFLGTKGSGSSGLSFPAHPHIRVLTMSFCPGGWRQKLHYLGFVLWVFWWSLRWRPKWIYASDPLSAPAALLSGLLTDVGLIYHEHDSPVGKPVSAFMRVVMVLRKRIAKRSDVVILPNAQRVKIFAEEVNIAVEKISCVWNCPAYADAIPFRVGERESDMWIHYHGNISPHLLPLAVIDALALLPPQIKLRVIGYETVGSVGYLNALKTKADNLGLGDRIELYGAMQREELLAWTRKADIGIALFPISTENRNMQYMTGASNKPFDYLACGCPLLVSNLPDWEEMFVQRRLALGCNPEDPGSIATAVWWYFEHPVECTSMGEKGRQRVQKEWNYESQFMGIKKLLEARP